MPGPLPQENRRRRNAPTIPTTNLPAGGCDLEVPEPPSWVDLGKRGRAWWEWAWSTPQAAAWSAEAHLDTVAHRAALEDDMAAIESQDFAGLDEDDLRGLIRMLKRIVSGDGTIIARMQSYDDRLGLSPKSMAQLRWKIVEDDKKPAEQPDRGDNVIVSDRWKRTGS